MAQVYDLDEPATYVTPPKTSGGGGSSSNDPYNWQGVYGTPIPADVLRAMNAAADAGDAATTDRYFMQWFGSNNAWFVNGQSNGLYQTWAQYTAWRSGINEVYTTAYNHPVSDAEIAGYATAGHDNQWVAKQVAGQVSTGTLAAPIKSMFTDAEIAQMSSGSVDGQRLADFASWALQAWPTMQQLGKPIDRGSMFNAYTSGTPASVYANAVLSGSPGAYQDQLMPNTRSLFTPGELGEIDQFRSGNVTPNGGSLSSFADYAQSLISAAMEYGQPIPSRGTIQNMYNSGLLPGAFSHQMDRAENAADAAARDAASTAHQDAAQAAADLRNHPVYGAAVRSFFTPTELAALDSGRADSSIHAFADYVNDIMDYSIRYGGPIPDRATIQALFDKGEGAATYGSLLSKAEQDQRDAASEARADARQAASEARAKAERLATATADVQANTPDYQRAVSAQGAPGYTDFDQGAQSAMANQAAGVGDTQGARWQVEIEKAMARMKANFGGVLQGLDRAGYGFLSEKRPDVAA